MFMKTEMDIEKKFKIDVLKGLNRIQELYYLYFPSPDSDYVLEVIIEGEYFLVEANLVFKDSVVPLDVDEYNSILDYLISKGE